MPYIFSVEGNIGSGKSTLLKELKKTIKRISNHEIIYLQEPVHEWESIKDENGKTILEKFYNNQQQYAFSFQIMAYISRLSLIKKAIKEYPNAIIIIERSVFTDKEVFAKMLYDEKKIEHVNYQIYLKWFDEFIKEIPITGIIYVTTTPEISKERVDSRARNGETIPLTYLEKCHIYHENWLNQSNKQIYKFQGNKDFDATFTNESLDLIKSFIIRHVYPPDDPYMYTMCTS